MKPNDDLAVAALVCGVFAITPGCCCGPFGVPLSIAAVVMGLVAMNQIDASAGARGGKNLALAGVICGGIAIALDALDVVVDAAGPFVKALHV